MSTRTDHRKAQIVVLAARAEYERLLFRRAACEALGSLSPQALVHEATAGLRSAGMGWLGGALGTMRRYPMLLSLASSAVSGMRHGSPYARVGMLALLAWKFLRRRRAARRARR